MKSLKLKFYLILAGICLITVLIVLFGAASNIEETAHRYSSMSAFRRSTSMTEEVEEVEQTVNSGKHVVPTLTEWSTWTTTQLRHLFGYNGSTSKTYWEAQQVYITVPIWKYQDGGPDNYIDTTKRIRIHKNLAENLQECFEQLYEIKYPIVDECTAGYNYRPIANSSSLSYHSYGAAVDINWTWNMNKQTFEQWQAKYGNDPRAITVDVVNIFAMHGWGWGGDFKNNFDPMHFSIGEKKPQTRDTMVRLP